MSARAVAIVAAAGESRRMGFDKMRRDLGGVPALVRSVRRLSEVSAIEEIVLAVRPGLEAAVRDELVAPYRLEKVTRIVAGGETRVHTVWNALQAVAASADLVAIHDGARPFVTVAAVEACLRAAQETGGALLAMPLTPTIKQVNAAGCVTGTLDRSTLWGAATPQAFRLREFMAAYTRFWASGADANAITDDAQLFAAQGGTVRVVPSNEENIKLTTPLDWLVAEMLAQRNVAG